MGHFLDFKILAGHRMEPHAQSISHNQLHGKSLGYAFCRNRCFMNENHRREHRGVFINRNKTFKNLFEFVVWGKKVLVQFIS